MTNLSFSFYAQGFLIFFFNILVKLHSFSEAEAPTFGGNNKPSPTKNKLSRTAKLLRVFEALFPYLPTPNLSTSDTCSDSTPSANSNSTGSAGKPCEKSSKAAASRSDVGAVDLHSKAATSTLSPSETETKKRKISREKKQTSVEMTEVPTLSTTASFDLASHPTTNYYDKAEDNPRIPPPAPYGTRNNFRRARDPSTLLQTPLKNGARRSCKKAKESEEEEEDFYAEVIDPMGPAGETDEGGYEIPVSAAAFPRSSSSSAFPAVSSSTSSSITSFPSTPRPSNCPSVAPDISVSFSPSSDESEEYATADVYENMDLSTRQDENGQHALRYSKRKTK